MNTNPPEGGPPGPCGPARARERYTLLARLGRDLIGLGRSTILVQCGAGQPVIYLPLPDGRKPAVVAVQRADGGWCYLLPGGHEVPADGSPAAARHVAGGVRPW